MADNPFSLLGVSTAATAEQIADAWRSKIRELHPDANAGLPAAELERLTVLTARVNAAYDALKSDLEGERAKARNPVHTASPKASGTPQWTASPTMPPARIPGAWLFRRPVTLVLLVLAVIGGLLMLAGAGPSQPTTTTNSSASSLASTTTLASAGWYVGNCLAGNSVVVPVPCSAEHNGKIVASVGAAEYCPTGTDGTVFRDNLYYCVDIDA